MVWGKNGSTTNTTSSVITVSGISSGNKFIQTIFYKPSGSNSYGLEFNSDTGSNYERRRSYDGNADQTGTKTAFPEDALYWGDYGEFMVTNICNISGEETLGIAHMVTQNTAGAGNAPTRYEAVGKWITTDEITSIRTESAQVTDSNLTVLGSDLTPAAAVPTTIQDGLIFEETDTNKHYIYTASTDTWSEI
jgi:hypothetical protein